MVVVLLVALRNQIKSNQQRHSSSTIRSLSNSLPSATCTIHKTNSVLCVVDTRETHTYTVHHSLTHSHTPNGSFSHKLLCNGRLNGRRRSKKCGVAENLPFCSCCVFTNYEPTWPSLSLSAMLRIPSQMHIIVSYVSLFFSEPGVHPRSLQIFCGWGWIPIEINYLSSRRWRRTATAPPPVVDLLSLCVCGWLVFSEIKKAVPEWQRTYLDRLLKVLNINLAALVNVCKSNSDTQNQQRRSIEDECVEAIFIVHRINWNPWLCCTHRRTRWKRTKASCGGTRKLTFWLVVVLLWRCCWLGNSWDEQEVRIRRTIISHEDIVHNHINHWGRPHHR